MLSVYIVTVSPDPARRRILLLRRTVFSAHQKDLNTLKWNQAAVKTYKRKRLIIYVHERMHSPMYDYIQRASALITYQAPFGGLDNTTSNLSVACCAGGATRNRTGDKGFADLCLTAWLWRRIQFLKKSTDRIARSVDHWSG